MSQSSSFEELWQAIRSAQRIAIACHVRPDGDAIGSLIGLGHSLTLAGKSVLMFSEDGVPRHLRYLPHSDEVRASDGLAHEVDVAIALDTSTKERLGERTNATFAHAGMLINIDHHGTNPFYGQLNHIDTRSPATAQIIYEFLGACSLPVNDAIRQNLYVGINTDTGSFQYSNTTPRTLRIVAEMMEAGLDTADLCQKIYETRPIRRLHLLRALLNDLKVSLDGKIASYALSQKTQQDAGALPGDTEELTDTLRCIEGVVAAVLFEEMPDGKVRVSSRSKDRRLNVSDVCATFGGGGHPMAAGARMQGPLQEAEASFLQALENEIKRIG